jgi:hypothetical protein
MSEVSPAGMRSAEFVDGWIAAFDAHDLARILRHYQKALAGRREEPRKPPNSPRTRR